MLLIRDRGGRTCGDLRYGVAAFAHHCTVTPVLCHPALIRSPQEECRGQAASLHIGDGWGAGVQRCVSWREGRGGRKGSFGKA